MDLITGDCFTFVTVNMYRYAVVFATAGSHDPSFTHSRLAS